MRLADVKTLQETLVEEINGKSVIKHKQGDLAKQRAVCNDTYKEQQALQANTQAIKQQIREEATAKDEEISKLKAELCQASQNAPPKGE
jgi:capsule polysaccharide export protein KpsE/RkpR